MTMVSTQMAMPGQRLARGVCRYLQELGYIPLTEFVPCKGLRVDVAALGPKSEFWIIECKSSLADFRTDQKWQNYLEWCDRYYWAVSPDFPLQSLPANSGVILADDYGAELLREAPEMRLAHSRRKTLVQTYARQAAQRLQRLVDPRA